MKVALFLLLSAVTLKVCAGRAAADEKQTAINEINTKLKEVNTTGNNVKKAIQEEKAAVTKSAGEKELLQHLDAKVNTTRSLFEDDARAVIRTAIVQSKPISVIYCIRSITYSGYDRFTSTKETNRINILRIKEKKMQKIGFDDYAVEAILSGIKELVDQGLAKMKDATGNQIQVIKKETVGRCDSAMLLLGELEIYLHEPVLSQEYSKARQDTDRSLAVLKANLQTELDKCLALTKSYFY